MNKKQFKRHVSAIQRTSFVSASEDPIEYGLRRAQFREKQLRRLVPLVEQSPHFAEQIEDLEQKIAKSRLAQERFKSLMAGRGSFPSGEVRIVSQLTIHSTGNSEEPIR